MRRPTAHHPRLGSLLILGLLVTRCGTPPPPADAPIGLTPADRLRLTPQLSIVEVGADRVDIAWTIDRRREDILRGYNVYFGSDSSLVLRPTGDAALQAARFGGSHYPGDTDGNIRLESVTIDRLSSGERYFIHVRTVFPDGSESPASNQVRVQPRPQGTFSLVPRFQTGHDGFSFEDDGPVEGTSERNDLYLYTTEGAFYLASPDRLDRGLRATRFVDLGPAGSLDDHPAMPSSAPSADRIAVAVGRSIGVMLADGRMAKLRPIGVDADRDPPRVTCEYIFQPVRGKTSF